MKREELVELRAALVQLAKALETERACVLRVLRVLERGEKQSGEVVQVSDSDSVATSL